MLIGDGWAFVHVPKCGGTTVRRALRGREVADVLPMFPRNTVDHRFHWVMQGVASGAFGFVRHPATWLASYWSERKREGAIRYDRFLDRLWSDDVSEFVLRVALNAPGYVGEMFEAYSQYGFLYRLEDGIAPVLKKYAPGHGPISHQNRGERSPLSQLAVDAVAKSEAATLKRWGYA